MDFCSYKQEEECLASFFILSCFSKSFFLHCKKKKRKKDI